MPASFVATRSSPSTFFRYLEGLRRSLFPDCRLPHRTLSPYFVFAVLRLWRFPGISRLRGFLSVFRVFALYVYRLRRFPGISRLSAFSRSSDYTVVLYGYEPFLSPAFCSSLRIVSLMPFPDYLYEAPRHPSRHRSSLQQLLSKHCQSYLIY